jgi:uncharacterized protein YbjT (DUF2867 family)
MGDLILVTGGTGTLGRLLVPRLQAAGRCVRILSRRRGEYAAGVEHLTGDLRTGAEIDKAVKGARVIVHCAGTSKGDDVKAMHLVRAAKEAGSPHLVFISVVGCDRIPVRGRIDRAMFGYFGAKLAAEQVIIESGLPWTILRTSQFHDLIFKSVQGMARMPVIPVPIAQFQPIDAGEVADRLTELALGHPSGLVAEMAGPQIYDMRDLVRSYLRSCRKHRLLIRARLPGEAARAVREGANLSPANAVGNRTWEQFLETKMQPTRRSRVLHPLHSRLPSSH